MDRKRKLYLNTLTSLSYQIVTVICGFILPRLILSHYGSEVNGLVSSIGQFLGFITLMEMGVGAVVQSSLYEPLAKQDTEAISAILTSARNFFRKIAFALICYVIVLCLVFPYISENNFGWVFTATLIVILSIGSFTQYVFGIVDRLLLTSDQKGYIIYGTNIVSIFLNTVACVIAVQLSASIHTVKLISALVFMIAPILIHIYVCKNYHINYKMRYDYEPIKQKWNGIAQHISAVILDGTDMVVLTTFSSLSNVSIYAVYNLVVKGITSLTLSLTNGVQALLGEMWAKKEEDSLNNFFGWVEWAVHTGTVFVFGCCTVLIVPFVSVYTNGVTDANYIAPLFGFLLTMANAGHCLRLPYNLMILAGGHYKQTQRCYIIAAALNLSISIVAVRAFGLIGVTIGTLIAMAYQTMWMAIYVSKNLIRWPIKKFIRQVLTDFIEFGTAYALTIYIPMCDCNFIAWVLLAIIDAFIWIVVIVLINKILYPQYTRQLLVKLSKKF